MNVSGLQISFNPGASYATDDPEAPEPEKEKTRSEARADAIKQFQRAAQQSTLPQIEHVAAQLLALVIQFRGVGGTMVNSRLPDQLREAADFMEDLPHDEERAGRSTSREKKSS